MLDLALVAERLDKLVDRRGGPNACWPWMASTTPGGYGKVWIDGRCYATHRLAYLLDHGTIDEDLLVLHGRTCTTRRCCNPRHLRQGTHRENTNDMHALGRGVYGEKHHTGKRRPYTQVTEVRARAKAGESQASISRSLGIPPITVSRYINNKRRTHGA